MRSHSFVGAPAIPGGSKKVLDKNFLFLESEECWSSLFLFLGGALPKTNRC
jgi:hypothetical protein